MATSQVRGPQLRRARDLSVVTRGAAGLGLESQLPDLHVIPRFPSSWAFVEGDVGTLAGLGHVVEGLWGPL